MNLKEVPYILAYKSINFGQILGNISSILLIRGCVFSNVQYTSKYQKSASESSLRLIRGSTYKRVYGSIVYNKGFGVVSVQARTGVLFDLRR